MNDIVLKYDLIFGWKWKCIHSNLSQFTQWNYGYENQQHARQDIAVKHPLAFVTVVE